MNLTRKYRRNILAFTIITASMVVYGMVNVTYAKSLQNVTVRLDWVISGYHAPFFVGVKKGYYKEEGLAVTVEPGNGSSTVTQSVGHGNDTFGLVDGGTMMMLVSKGLPVKAVMGILQKSPLSIVYNVKSGIKAPKDLEGKTIAVTNGEAPLILLPGFLKAGRVDESKVKLVSANPASKVAIMLNGQVDAELNFNFLGVPPLEAHGLKVGTLNYADYGVNIPGLCVITRDAFIKAHPEVIRRFVRATVKAYKWSIANPKKAIDILIAANPGDKIPEGSSLSTLKLSFGLLHTKETEDQPIGVMSKEDWENAQNILVQYAGLEHKRSPNAYFTNKFVRQQ